ncbi:MAG: TrpB-like pyridoxal-phosphate dependent enzyme [Chloroflexi bacterium RBG_16_57_8]|nr:MAG: TrpB-like pyridoxal-phosphate dependent enzyme [Chloroflexi bacterium RBG_16_57_8]
METTKFILQEKDMPTSWYNVLPDLPVPLPPPLHPATKKPVTPDDMKPLFPMALIMQEFSPDRYVEIPEEVQQAYRVWRPTALHRALGLEKALDTPAKIYYKYEGTSPAGSHKPNTAIAQAYYNKKEGIKRIVTETGAGQWGSALALGCVQFGIELKVYMVKVSFQQKPYRRLLMETWGAKCVASPSRDTKGGLGELARDPNSPGSLGLAISEAIEDCVTHENTRYSLGSVLNHVLMHQTVIGQEAMKQMEMAGVYPDIVIGCVGGGSNFAGIALPFLRDKLSGKKPGLRLIAVEPSACPSLTKGVCAYDFGDNVGMTPLLMMYTLGHKFMPPPVHAGGLRYHGMAPIISHLYKLGLIEARAVFQKPVFEAGVQFARAEGILPAPESNHAIKVAVDEALACKQSGQAKTILFNLSGHGHFDLAAYEEYLSGRLTDYEYPADKVKEALAGLPQVPA